MSHRPHPGIDKANIESSVASVPNLLKQQCRVRVWGFGGFFFFFLGGGGGGVDDLYQHLLGQLCIRVVMYGMAIVWGTSPLAKRYGLASRLGYFNLYSNPPSTL